MSKEPLSRKEVCEKLGISERTLRRKIKELDIECIGELLPNGVESKKISIVDFLRIADSCRNTPKPVEATKDLSVISTLKMELGKSQQELASKELLLNEKDKLIEIITQEKLRLQEDKKALQEDKKFLQEQIDKLTAAREQPKGFFKRLFG